MPTFDIQTFMLVFCFFFAINLFKIYCFYTLPNLYDLRLLRVCLTSLAVEYLPVVCLVLERVGSKAQYRLAGVTASLAVHRGPRVPRE